MHHNLHCDGLDPLWIQYLDLDLLLLAYSFSFYI